MAISSPSSSSIIDTLFCNEEQDYDHPYDHDDDDINDEHYDHSHVILTQTTLQDSSHVHNPASLNNQDFFWEHEELVSLFTKEQEQKLQTHPSTFYFDKTDPSLLLARKEAVDWILKVKSHFGFAHLTAILCINYVDRFLVSSLHFQKDKPWMIQLLAVTCLSLAAKVEETHVPTLLDLQVDTKYLFEPKNIQKMELLVMSTLKWKMNPVTPISFLDHIVRRLELNTHLQCGFVNKCETLILSLVSDSRFVGYQPSVLATATILHVIDQVDFINSVDYQTQLLDVLKTTKEKVKECKEMIMKASHSSSIIPKKRKFEEDDTMHNISVGVMDAHCLLSQLTSSSSSPHCRRYDQPTIKKMKIGQQQKFGFVSLSCKAFVNVASNPC